MQKLQFSLIAVAAFVLLHVVQSKVALDYACDPRQSEVTCLLGCLGCFEFYGGHIYDMARCCQECKDTQAYIVDDGPVKCSEKFLTGSWRRRFGGK